MVVERLQIINNRDLLSLVTNVVRLPIKKVRPEDGNHYNVYKQVL